MAWIYLLIAGVLEIGWPLGFKLADANPKNFILFIVLAAISMALSGLFLYLAQRDIPISTAYVMWTGIGAIGTVVIGIVFFNDPVTALRMLFLSLILVGVVGLKLSH